MIFKGTRPAMNDWAENITWCKEDALMVMLNATPGKSGYAVTYPTDEDKAKWLPEAANISTIIYRKNGDTGS